MELIHVDSCIPLQNALTSWLVVNKVLTGGEKCIFQNIRIIQNQDPFIIKSSTCIAW